MKLFYKSLRAFTLIELLIVIGIVAILGTAVVTVINPVEIIEQTRDTQRLTELKSIDSAISLGKSLNSNLDVSVATSTVFISLPDTNSACSSYTTLPALPSGWSYNCVTEADLRKVDGTGWIPLNFSSVVTGSPFASLPIDPKNTADGGLYYTYVKGSWELTSCFESNKYVTRFVDTGGCQKVTSIVEAAGVSITPSEVLARAATPPSSPTPHLVFSTYLGTDSFEQGEGIAVDSAGNVYVTGHTTSSAFPTTSGVYQESGGGSTDAFVTKFSSSGALVYSTYLGGDGDDYGYGIAVDSSGNVYITGSTSSYSFPQTDGSSYGGGSYDGFVSELNSNGTDLLYGAYLYGSGDEMGRDIALDSPGNIYITGDCNSGEFFSCASHGNAFVLKYDSDWNLIYSSRVAEGNMGSYGYGIAVDSSGNAYVTGYTIDDTSFSTGGAYQENLNGSQDAFLGKLDSDGNPVYVTYLGGNGEESGHGVAVDSSGNAYISGRTNSDDFPTTSGAYKTTYAGDIFVTKINPAGSGADDLIYSTFLGGDNEGNEEYGGKIAVDSSGNAYVTGNTWAIDFPTTSGAYQTTFGGSIDAFLTKLNSTGTDLIYSTYLGGSDMEYGYDSGYDVTVDSSGNAYVIGCTYSTDFPTTSGAYQTTLGGGGGNPDAFIAKFYLPSTPQPPPPSTPQLVFSTYLGGTADDRGFGITSDSSGNTYVTGYAWSSDFPTTSGAYQTANVGGNDAFVAKINPSGTDLVYSTYLGGSDNETPYGIAVDSSGNAYITGTTGSSDFPTTSGVYQTSLGGSSGSPDVFVSKLNPSGTDLVYSTYFGGSFWEEGNAIKVDSSGNAYITGSTGSGDLPTTSGAYQTSPASGTNAFVTKLNSSGTDLVYSTYLGGSDYEDGKSLALDSSGNAYITGSTGSADFPTTSGAYQTSIAGGYGVGYDVYVTKLNSSGTDLVYSTYLGGSNGDNGYGIAVDSSGNAYITGGAGSSDFPTTSGAYQTTQPSGYSPFVTKLNSSGTDLVYSTYLGGSSGDNGYGIAVDSSGNAYITGLAGSSDFPTTSGAYQTSPGGSDDTFFTKLNPSGTDLVYSTYLGGSNTDQGYSIAVDSSGNAYITGITNSSDLPTTSGAYQTTYDGSGEYDAFIAKFHLP